MDAFRSGGFNSWGGEGYLEGDGITYPRLWMNAHICNALPHCGGCEARCIQFLHAPEAHINL